MPNVSRGDSSCDEYFNGPKTSREGPLGPVFRQGAPTLCELRNESVLDVEDPFDAVKVKVENLKLEPSANSGAVVRFWVSCVV